MLVSLSSASAVSTAALHARFVRHASRNVPVDQTVDLPHVSCTVLAQQQQRLVPSKAIAFPANEVTDEVTGEAESSEQRDTPWEQ